MYELVPEVNREVCPVVSAGASCEGLVQPRQLSLSLASPCTVAEQVSYSSSLHFINQVVWLGCTPQLRSTWLSQHSLGSQPSQLRAAAFRERHSSQSSASLREQFCSLAVLGIASEQQEKLLCKDHTVIKVGKTL